MRNLFIFRHAEAEPYCEDDYGRRLIDIGRKQAFDSGQWLQQQAVFDFILCSGAARTRETLACAFPNSLPCPVVYDDLIYEVGADGLPMEALYKLFCNVPAEAQHVLLVGHNPTAPQLALDIDCGKNTFLYNQIYSGFGKAAIARLEIDGLWSDIPVCNGTLRDVFTPEQV